MKSKKAIIKDCAAKLFRKKGYTATSMRDLAEKVGMEAPSLYNHIKSKQEILRELLMDMAHRFMKGMEEIDQASIPSIEKLERLVAFHIRMTIDHPDAIALITGEWAHLESPARENYFALREAYENRFKRILEQCMADGYIDPVNTDIALFSILSSLHWLYSWYNRHQHISPIDLEKEMIHCLVNGLRK